MNINNCKCCGSVYREYCDYCFVKVRCTNCDTRHLVTRNTYYTKDYLPCDDCKDIPYMEVLNDNPVFTYRRTITI